MKIRALVFCDDLWHPAATIRRGLEGLGSSFDFEFVEDALDRSAGQLEGFRLMVLAKANMVSSRSEQPWLTGEAGESLAAHIRRGNGLVVIHAGTSRYENLPAMHALMGGGFVRHPEQCAVTIEPVSGRGLAEGILSFTVRDEHYFMSPVSDDAEVFLQSRSMHGVQPAGWTRSEGEGRVCVLTPGHNLEVWLHPEFQKLLLNACRWTAKLN